MTISGDTRLSGKMALGALRPEKIPEGASFQVTAELPDGRVYPLIWLNNYKMNFNHAFILRTGILFPAGTMVRGVPQSAVMGLVPASDVPPPPKRPAKQIAPITTHSE